MTTLTFSNGKKRVVDSLETIEALIEEGFSFNTTEYNDETDNTLPFLDIDEYGNIIIYK